MLMLGDGRASGENSVACPKRGLSACLMLCSFIRSVPSR